MTKTYRELICLPTFEERYDYLRMGGVIGRDTFGFDRHLNQALYRSKEWQRIRDQVLTRDEGCDLGMDGYPVPAKPIVHHINPISIEDIEARSPKVFDLNNLITTSHNTHNAIHFGDASLLPKPPIERRQGDTSLWIRV